MVERHREERKQRYIDEMPPGVGEVFWALRNDVLYLHTLWETFRGLYGESEERVELLDRTAPEFFMVTRYAFTEHVVLGIARLTDPATDSQGNENISFELLVKRVAKAGETNLADRLVKQLDLIESGVKSIRQSRNKWLAHSDVRVRLATGEEQLSPSVTVNDVNVALEAVRAFMHEAEYELDDGVKTMYQDTVSGQLLGPLLVLLESVEDVGH